MPILALKKEKGELAISSCLKNIKEK